MDPESKPRSDKSQSEKKLYWGGHRTEKMYTGRGGHCTYFVDEGTIKVGTLHDIWRPDMTLSRHHPDIFNTNSRHPQDHLQTLSRLPLDILDHHNFASIGCMPNYSVDLIHMSYPVGVGGWWVANTYIIMPLRGSILQVGTCQILISAENPRWSQVHKSYPVGVGGW